MLQIVILAGGLATRMRPLTNDIPKSLIKVNGMPFLFHQLNLLYKRGFNNIHFCLGHLGEMVENEIKMSGLYDKINFSFSYDGTTQLGTGGAIKNAEKYLDQTFFVIYGDSYLDISYDTMLSFHIEKQNKNASTMAIFKNKNKLDQSNVYFDGINLRYCKFNPTPDMQYIDYGVGILNKSFFNKTFNFPFDLANLYEDLSKMDLLNGFEVHNRFYEIGSPEGLIDISNYLKKQK